MLVSIAIEYGINDIGDLHFPFMAAESDFGSKGPQKKMMGLPDDVKDIIFKMKPWKTGGDQDLWGLGQLANVDKHRMLIPFGAIGGPSFSNFMVNGGSHPGSVGLLIQQGDLLKGVTFSKIG